MNVISSCFASLTKMTALTVVAIGLTLTPALSESASATSVSMAVDDQLSGTTWMGTEELPAPYGPLTFQFKADGKAVMIDGRDTVEGTYRIEGNQVIVDFPGSSIYTGAMNGNTITGLATAANPKLGTWNFRVNKS